MSEALKHTRLELQAFPENLRKHVDPKSPPPLRAMAAKAMVPMGPTDLVTVLYQLNLDPDTNVRKAASESLRDLPPEMVDGVLGAKLDARVLDLLAKTFLNDDKKMERLVTNHSMADQSIAWLSERVSEMTAEIIAGIHVRLLRFPAIIEGLYLNPNTRMSTVDKVIDLARRNDVSFDGLPALQKALDSPAYSDQQGEPLTDEDFASLLRDSVSNADKDMDEDDARIDALLKGEEKAANAEEELRLSKWQKIEKMSPPQKIRLAIIGGKEDRAILLRDSRKLVHMAAIQSPKVSPGEATKLASNRSLPDGVIAYIARKREWIRYYPIVSALVNNPKTPLSDSMTFLKQLRPNDLRSVQRNKNIPSQLARQASMLARKKGR